jgi:hypothetical protein
MAPVFHDGHGRELSEPGADTTTIVLAVVFPVLFCAIPCLACAIMCCPSAARRKAERERMNAEDWKIAGLPKVVLPVRMIDSACCCAGAFLSLLNSFAVQPALKKSLKQMELADAEGKVAKVLCDADAREAFRARVEGHVSDLRSSPTLSLFGKIAYHGEAANMCGLHAKFLKLGMGATSQKVASPVFIVSNPRTCTTILHRTMALDRARWRVFDFADYIAPLPLLDRDDTAGRKRRAKKANGLLQAGEALFPGLQACLETMHGFRPEEAEEDLGWYDIGLGMRFMDALILTYPTQRRNGSPLEDKPTARYRYAWLHMVMQVYQQHGKAEADERPWLMKDPNHAAYLPELVAQFPDAKFIFTHRRPAEIVASMAKLFMMIASPFHNP